MMAAPVAARHHHLHRPRSQRRDVTSMHDAVESHCYYPVTYSTIDTMTVHRIAAVFSGERATCILTHFMH